MNANDERDTAPQVAATYHLGAAVHAMECVTADGSTELWLHVPGPQSPVRVPLHEQTGPLNTWWRARIDDVLTRCTAATLHGSRCARRARTPGGVCGTHARRDAENLVRRVLDGRTIERGAR